MSSHIRTIDALRKAIAEGGHFEYLFFWGHRQAQKGVIDKSCLSQWYPAAFRLDAIDYASAEHYMMAEKARVFGDEETRAEILEANTPSDAKRLGRRVRHFDRARWQEAGFDIVVRGNVAKFSQNDGLRDFLLSTGDCILVEASPQDAIWGIGMAATHPDVSDPRQWQGLNLLGFALMEARMRLPESVTGTA